MNSEIIKAFSESTANVFLTMLGQQVAVGAAQFCSQMLARHEVSGIIGLSGRISGDVIVSFDETVAVSATSALLGVEPTDMSNDVVDAVGELTNMIAGSAKGMLEQYELSLALPTVVLGSGHRIGFKSGIDPVSVPFDSSWGKFSVELGLTETEPAKHVVLQRK